MSRPQIHLVPRDDPQAFADVLYSGETMTLRELLERAPARSTEPLDEDLLDRSLDDLRVLPKAEWNGRLYDPPGISPEPTKHPDPMPEPAEDEPPANTPEHLSDSQSVLLAYAREIEQVAGFLRAGLSVLVLCDKLVVGHLWPRMARQAGLEAVELTIPDSPEGEMMPRSLRQRQLDELRSLLRGLKEGHVLVIPHLDLLTSGGDTLTAEAREITELVYQTSQGSEESPTATLNDEDERLLLAFADRSLSIPEVLGARFAVRILISGVPRMVRYPDGDEQPLGAALVTRSEQAHFVGFNAEGLYKNVAGMNPIRLRHAIAYAIKERAAGEPIPVTELYQAIRAFKAQTSARFEVPDVSFADIGGYEDVKAELGKALALMAGSVHLPNERLRRELLPRGFIFYGPPGTGKTLFAKAIANQLNATIQVVSGPEVTDMYVGESERKVREIFAEARRNAPAVVVFDEFDSIASQRSGRDDGGSRAGNAVVAQILTEMDGFRPEVPLLVIGTTNRLDIIDEALMRPSRFRAIGIDLPDPTARRAIAAVHARHFEVDVSPALLDVLASATAGFNGDEIRSIFRDACFAQHCEKPPRPADARQLGRLVGALRNAGEQRAAESARTSLARGPRSRGGPPTPTDRMIDLTAESSPTSSDEAEADQPSAEAVPATS